MFTLARCNTSTLGKSAPDINQKSMRQILINVGNYTEDYNLQNMEKELKIGKKCYANSHDA